MSLDTLQQHSHIIQTCKAVFIEKNKDYGMAWSTFHLPTFVDQIMIKARRIITIGRKKKQLVADDINTELIGIVNYAIMALMMIDLKGKIPPEEVFSLYDKYVAKIRRLVEKKNHDYNDAWRGMQLSSMVDIILMKIYRINNMHNSNRKVRDTEGIGSNYQDIANYAIFCLIRLTE